MKVHRSCGGEVIGRKCQKCGKVWGRTGSALTRDIVAKKVGFDEKAYKERIRNLKDISR